ncbi:MAG: hypothetical protein FWG91_12720 [Lachnospiraceae bacterium]|nr:hypothetical protein [Lachnospiraceae bacterium]
MKKFLLVSSIIAVLFGVICSQKVNAAEPDGNFLSVEEAIRIGNSFVDDFNQIVKDGAIEQYYGTWAYDFLLDWSNVLNEIGTFYGIKSTTATVDSEKAVIKILVHGTKRLAVIDFVLYLEEVPEVNVYSKFSMTKWLVDSGVGAFLLILNTAAVVALFILVLRRPKALAKLPCSQMIDDTIAHIIRSEENNEAEAEVEFDEISNESSESEEVEEIEEAEDIEEVEEIEEVEDIEGAEEIGEAEEIEEVEDTKELEEIGEIEEIDEEEEEEMKKIIESADVSEEEIERVINQVRVDKKKPAKGKRKTGKEREIEIALRKMLK